MPESAALGTERRPQHRSIVERILITGTLQLDTPAHFGNGDADAFTDLPLLRDEAEGHPLLLGTSLAGALRNFVCAVARSNAEVANAGKLFGAEKGFDQPEDDKWQSHLIVHDALGKAADYERRDGVAIDQVTCTAADDKKFDIQLLAAGSTFELRFELLIADESELARQKINRRDLLTALAIALSGLERGEISMGARKRRGLGRCSVQGWSVRRYDLCAETGLLAWLVSERENPGDWAPTIDAISEPTIKAALEAALGEPFPEIQSNLWAARLTAEFSLQSSLLVRSGIWAETDDEDSEWSSDMVHLHSPRSTKSGGQKLVPIVAGTSWGGALRSRATRIVNTIAAGLTSPVGNNDQRAKAQGLIADLFGPSDIARHTDNARASRLSISETEITGGRMLEQTRVKLDRFTGGSFASALFSEQPLFGNRNTRLKLNLTLCPAYDEEASDQRQQAEIGLLLLLLKDLWTGDLPLGGEVGIGRGRLQGVRATLEVGADSYDIAWKDDGRLSLNDDQAAVLQKYVDALVKELT